MYKQQLGTRVSSTFPVFLGEALAIQLYSLFKVQQLFSKAYISTWEQRYKLGDFVEKIGKENAKQLLYYILTRTPVFWTTLIGSQTISQIAMDGHITPLPHATQPTTPVISTTVSVVEPSLQTAAPHPQLLRANETLPPLPPTATHQAQLQDVMKNLPPTISTGSTVNGSTRRMQMPREIFCLHMPLVKLFLLARLVGDEILTEITEYPLPVLPKWRRFEKLGLLGFLVVRINFLVSRKQDCRVKDIFPGHGTLKILDQQVTLNQIQCGEEDSKWIRSEQKMAKRKIEDVESEPEVVIAKRQKTENTPVHQKPLQGKSVMLGNHRLCLI